MQLCKSRENSTTATPTEYYLLGNSICDDTVYIALGLGAEIRIMCCDLLIAMPVLLRVAKDVSSPEKFASLLLHLSFALPLFMNKLERMALFLPALITRRVS